MSELKLIDAGINLANPFIEERIFMILQLNPSIPVETPKGKGQAVMIIDYSTEHDLYWVVFDDLTHQCWTFNNKDIRAQTNITFNRMPAEKPHLPRPLAPAVMHEQKNAPLSS